MPNAPAQLATALMLGFLHALEVDHMIAVTTFVAGRPSPRTAAAFGLRWGIGHSVAVLLLGGLLLVTGVHWPARYDAWGEALVGVMLVGLGLWAIRSSRKLHLHPPAEHGDHAHLHLHGSDRPAHTHGHGAAPRPAHDHRHGVTLVGLMHGLAGTSGVVALVPVSLIHRLDVGLAYLVTFGVGVTAGMMVYAVIAAVAVQRAGARSLAWGRRIAALVGVAGIATGCWWIWSVVGR